MGSAHMSQVCKSGSGGGRVAIRRNADKGPAAGGGPDNGLGACGSTGTVRPSNAHRDGHAQYTITVQQRQRIEMMIAVQAGAGSPSVIARPAMRTDQDQIRSTVTESAFEYCAGQAVVACRTVVPICEEVGAQTAGNESNTVPLESTNLPRRKLGHAGNRQPGGRSFALVEADS